MGFNSENGRRLVFDIECASIPDAAEFIEPATAPANYKDQAKIDAYIQEKGVEQLQRCALDPDLCRVVAICVWDEGNDGPAAVVNGPEHEMLDWFWTTSRDRHLVGFNVLSYDLPVLLRRSLYLGVKSPLIQIDRFKHPEVTDLLSLLSFNGVQKVHSLSFYAKRFGCPVTDTMDGSGIGLAVTEGRWDDVKAHVLADVQKTAWVAAKCGYFTRALAGVF